MSPRPPSSTLFPYTTLFRSGRASGHGRGVALQPPRRADVPRAVLPQRCGDERGVPGARPLRSEEHTSELQSLRHLVCRLLLEKKKNEELSKFVGRADRTQTQ